MNTDLNQLLERIHPADPNLREPGQARLDSLTKPQGSLGRLEELALQMYMAQGGGQPAADPARIFTVAGDHGVAAEGVSAFPQEVTRQMVHNFLNGGAGINVLARTVGAELYVVNAGVAGDLFDQHPALIQHKMGNGTANFTQGPAMSTQLCSQALLFGAQLADQAHRDGIRTLLTGDMGIANTTPSTALYCAHLDLEPEDITGPGTGLSNEGLSRKIRAVERALQANAEAVQSRDPLRILAGLGGFEIAVLAGLILGGAANQQMILVDGFISTAAYVSAWKFQPHVADYAVLSHASAEQGHGAAVRALGGRPLLDLGFRLGEGTGAATALFLLRAAADIFNTMATFDEAGVTEGE
ncbi:MAG: nicotinate-nucleotide--dimethylbenzimidazole phosphoribosyltransferase [Desulfovibrio sp.]|jgi:nicotinate-nucleotide--dimethylbenzimidazole phosphoribosyltransferase|nr:nicotinate-nucleotide--dimethylbenzimidazole phosphoribosyltransferase [Desulfovibrio sp.]